VAVPSERHLRNQLAENLSLIESGLRLHRAEYPLPNSYGTKGFIDLLARDRHGMWVVIELKRSRGPARQALHEVAKYAELLAREKSLPSHEIRTVIVSIDWDELLVSVSNVARDWLHDLRGYRLILDDAGAPVAAERVPLIPAPFEHRLTPIHFIYFYHSPRDRDQGWQQVLHHASETGCEDLVGVDLRYVGPPGRVVAPLALYIGFGCIEPAWIPDISASAEDDEDEYDDDNPYGPDYHREYRALCNVTRHVFAETSETGRPDVFASLRKNPSWKIESVRGVGAYARDGLRSDEDILLELAGQRGEAQILFSGSASTKVASRWNSLKEAARNALAGNDAWTILVDNWCDGVADRPEERDVVLRIFNPADLIQTFMLAQVGRLDEAKPRILGVATSPDDGSAVVLEGGLYWNGRPVDNLKRRVQMIYLEATSWIAHKAMGATWWLDRELVELLNLSYVGFEHLVESPARGPEQDPVILLVRDGVAQRFTLPARELLEEGWQGLYPLGDFLRAHQDQVNDLLEDYPHGGAFEP
jgi:hypothetical protein